jgi:ubiquinone/menaquinone biosynthesis C-methylase UbiE
MRHSTGQIIAQWREDPEHEDFIKRLYYDKDVRAAAHRFSASEEFQAVLQLARRYGHPNGRIIDIGGGNGVAALAWARAGYESYLIDPDASDVVGLGAVPDAKCGIRAIQAIGEMLPLAGATFDIIYGRQVLHHLSVLPSATREFCRVLKPRGIALFTREHVVDHSDGLARFLERHPLHRYTGEENAYTERDYLAAFDEANLTITEILRSYDSTINLYPQTKSDLDLIIFHTLRQYVPNKRMCWRLAKFGFVRRWVQAKLSADDTLQGRLYTFVLTKSDEFDVT